MTFETFETLGENETKQKQAHHSLAADALTLSSRAASSWSPGLLASPSLALGTSLGASPKNEGSGTRKQQ